MLTKTKKTLLVGLTVLCFAMLAAFGLSETPFSRKSVKADDEKTAAVAAIGETEYGTLQSAIAAAKSGDTINLLCDVENSDYTMSNVINLALAKGVTLEGNGYTLSGNIKVTVASEGDVTIDNVKFKDIHNDQTVDADNKKKYGFSDDKVGMLSAIYAPKLMGSVVITNCEFDNADWEDLQISPALGAKITIKNNVFKTSASETVKGQLRHVHVEMAYSKGVFDYEGTDIELTITDNQIDANVKDAALGAWWIGLNSKLELSGNYIENVDNVSITLSTKEFKRENRNDLIFPARSNANVDQDDLTRNVLVIADAFNSVSYDTLAAAIAAAKDGDTVKLLADCSGNGIAVGDGKFGEAGLTVDFGGHVYTVGGVLVGSSGTGTNAFQLLKNNNITFRNGSIIGVTEGTKPAEDTPDWHGAPAMIIQNYSNLTLKNMVISGGDETVYTMSNNNGEIVIEDTTINIGKAKGYSYGPYAFDVCRYNSYPSVSVTVKGNSIINGNVEISGTVGNGQSRQLNIEGGEFNGKFKVSDAPANIAISGGTFGSEVPEEYCAEGFRVAKKGDTYAVVEKYITSSWVTLGTDISFNYRADTTKKIDKAEVSYDAGATEPTVYELTAKDGVYTFTGITPQMIDRKISVTVYADGYVVYDVVNYSVLDYLKEVLALNDNAETTKNLVASLAYYGKAAMNYVGYDTKEVEKFITDNNLQQSEAEISGVSQNDGKEKAVKVSVKFDSQNKIVLAVAEGETDNYNYTIKVNGKEVESVEWKSGVIEGYKVYLTEGIAAKYITAEDYCVEVEVKKGGEVVQSLKYNVAGYCQKLLSNEKFGEMAKATYYYGVAAAEYAKAKEN